MTPLAQRLQVFRSVISGLVIEMGNSEHHADDVGLPMNRRRGDQLYRGEFAPVYASPPRAGRDEPELRNRQRDHGYRRVIRFATLFAAIAGPREDARPRDEPPFAAV